MRKLLSALLLIVAAETAALACSCAAPVTPEGSRPLARQLLRGAIAIVEVDVLSEYRQAGLGEHVRVRRILWGRAPRDFRIERRGIASSASCDLLLTRGQRKRLILYPAAIGGHRRFVIQNLCSDFLLGDPRFFAITLEEARRR